MVSRMPNSLFSASFVPFVDVKVPTPPQTTAPSPPHPSPPAPHPFPPVPQILQTHAHLSRSFTPNPRNSAPNLPPWCQLVATPLRDTCHPHANPALNFVTPPPPAERRATPLLTRPAHPCYASLNKGPTCHPPFRPIPAAIRGGRTRYRAPRCSPARSRRTPILSPNVPKRSRFDAPSVTSWDSSPATKSAQWCILEHFPLTLPAPVAVYAVSSLVNSVANDGPELIARIA